MVILIQGGFNHGSRDGQGMQEWSSKSKSPTFSRNSPFSASGSSSKGNAVKDSRISTSRESQEGKHGERNGSHSQEFR